VRGLFLKKTSIVSLSIDVRITLISGVVCLLRISKMFHGLMNNPVVYKKYVLGRDTAKVFNNVPFPSCCVWLLRVADPPQPTGSSQFTRRVINLAVIASCKSPVYDVVSVNLVCNKLLNS